MTQYGIMSETDRTKELHVNLQRKRANIETPRKIQSSTPYMVNMVSGLETDLKKYRAMLRKQYDTFQVKPEMLIIENEENNRIFYKGTPEQYIQQLTVAVAEFGENTCTNGGLTKTGIIGLLHEKLPAPEALALQRRWGLQLKSDDFKRTKEFCRDCLDAYKGLPIAGVNLHCYVRNRDQVEDFMDACNMVADWTNKPVLTTEAGMYVDDGDTTSLLLGASNILTHFIFFANKTSKSAGLYGANKTAWLEFMTPRA